METCYLCDGPGDTADHIPPRGFFPPPRPLNLITVRCCNECNNKWSKDDEAIRAIFSVVEGRSTAGDRIWEDRVVPRTLEKRAGFREYMLQMSEQFAVRTQIGFKVVTAFTPPMERIEPFLIRLTKGLLRHHFPSCDYRNSLFDVRFVPLTEEELLETLRGTKLAEVGEGTFFYRYGLSDTGLSSIWYLVFYECLGFLIVQRKKD